MNDDFRQIIEEKQIDTVFQPIASLNTGKIEGYEALSRITAKNPAIGIEGLFSWAKKNECLWELEKVCRMRALEKGRVKPDGSKLFLNVDANIMYDPNLKAGFTRQILEQYNLIPAEVIIEVTEKSTIMDDQAFASAIEHYKNQDFSIAIDDFGAGYSGINRACAYAPEYIKLDMEMVRNVQEDSLKKAAIKGIVQFCKESDIKVIAEGIESREELLTLLSLGVDYGQGYFLGRPEREFRALSKEFMEIIESYHRREPLERVDYLLFDLMEPSVQDDTVDDVAVKAMEREPRCLYDDVVVLVGDYYLGSVSVKQLLLTSINLKIKKTVVSNLQNEVEGNGRN